MDGAASLPLQQHLEDAQEALLDSQVVDGIRTENVSLVDVKTVKLQKILDIIDANKAELQHLQAEIAHVTRDKPNHAQQVHDVIESNFENSGNDNSFACIDAVSARDNCDINESSVGKHATNSADQCQFTNVNKFLKSLATTLALAKEVTMD